MVFGPSLLSVLLQTGTLFLRTLSVDTKASLLTCSPSVCLDSKMRLILESKPLVSSQGGKKVLDIPDPMFNQDKVSFKEMPVFCGSTPG